MNPAFYEMVCTHAGLGLIAADADLVICMWNASATRVLGQPAEAMIGRPIAEAVGTDRREEADRLFRKVLSDHYISELEMAHTDPRGQSVHLRVTISPVLDPDGRAIGVSALIRDITRRVALQKRVARHQKMAALGALAGSVAHHFNNLLGGIVTSVDYALESGEPRATRRALEVTADSVARAGKLIDRLRAFAEGDRRGNHAPDLTDLTETVLHFVDRIEEGLRTRGVKLSLSLHPIPVVEVPGMRLLTVLGNLLDNALEAMPTGGELEIRIERANGNVLIRMADTGVGMEEDHLERVFEPFFSTKTREPGSQEQHLGLGLAAAHGIVNELGGEITVSSQPGRGSGFDIVLPLEQQDYGT